MEKKKMVFVMACSVTASGTIDMVFFFCLRRNFPDNLESDASLKDERAQREEIVFRPWCKKRLPLDWAKYICFTRER